jgi:hypothetical protein
MIEVYKIIQGHYDPEASTIIKLMNDTEQRLSTRTNSRKVVYNRANTNIRKNSFSIRIANDKFFIHGICLVALLV